MWLTYPGKVAGVNENIDEYFSFGFNTINYEIITDPLVIAEVGNTFYWNQTNL